MKNQNNNKIKIYTDGACSGNPGPGGWGAVIIDNKLLVQLAGYEKNTTNNRMELSAALQALCYVKENYENNDDFQFNLFVDSKYLMKGFTEWMPNWKKNNWLNSSKKPVKNQDLWQKLDVFNAFYCDKITWQWVKGHNQDYYNEMADMLARKAISIENQYKNCIVNE